VVIVRSPLDGPRHRRIMIVENRGRKAMNRFRTALFVLAGAVLAAGADAASAAAQAVNHVTAIAKPRHYEGPCPASIEFVATIFVNHPAQITYRWERSDHATGPALSVFISGAGRGVTTTWQLSRPPAEVFRAGEVLHVLSPGDVYSNPAEFSLICR
jgi:hypothetical protein